MAKEGIERSGQSRREALVAVGEQFNVGGSVKHLQSMMTEVTAKEVNAQTVQAACACVTQINSTIKTAIMAAKYLSDK